MPVHDDFKGGRREQQVNDFYIRRALKPVRNALGYQADHIGIRHDVRRRHETGDRCRHSAHASLLAREAVDSGAEYPPACRRDI